MNDTETERQFRLEEFSEKDIDLMRKTVARGSSEEELALFIEQCRRTGLDPFARQIYSVRRKQWNSRSRAYEDAQVIQVSIDGFRLIADRTRQYAGQVGPWWCARDGEWKEVWLDDEPPAAARVGVLRHDFIQPLFAVAIFKAYVQTNSAGEAISRWKTDPAGMLAKCAESLALRRAFPAELSGLYTADELSNVKDDAPQPEQAPGQNGNKRKTAAPAPAAAPKREGERPFRPLDLRAAFVKAVAHAEAHGLVLGPDDFPITESALSNLFELAPFGAETETETYLEFVTGIPYLEDLSEAHVVALMRILKPRLENSVWLPAAEAQIEAQAVLEYVKSKEGAAELAEEALGHVDAAVIAEELAAEFEGAVTIESLPAEPPALIAVIGKNKYPKEWARGLAAYSRCNRFELDGILQKLIADTEEPLSYLAPVETVSARVDAYLDKKG